MIVLFLFAFLSGLVTILAPCIWPLLPIVLSSAIAGKGRQRPLGISLGVVMSFAFFTLALSSLVRIFHFDPNSLRLLAVIVIGVLGLVMLIPALSKYVELAVSRLSSLWGRRGQSGSGFWGGFVTGLTLGIVWAPCAGPILAAIAALSATGHVTADVVLVTIAYAVGIGVPLFLIALGGQKIMTKTKRLSPYTGRIQQVFGLIMIIAAVAIYTNYDTYVEAKLLNAFPALSTSLTSFETGSTVSGALSNLKQNAGTNGSALTDQTMMNLFNVTRPVAAPELAGITHWLNIPEGQQPPTMASLKGKVVLVDFWTYTCINCIRTLPHVTAWYDKYKDDGFVVLGIHTPEFAFEKETNNVADAIKQFNIHYPVAQDNDYGTWNAYGNQYWPAEYLIDAAGNVRRVHFGEGEYDEMEEAIQALLKEAGQTNVTTTLNTMPDMTPSSTISPESYLGSDRSQFFYPDGSTKNGAHNYTLSALPENTFGFGGSWTIDPTYATAGKDAVLDYHFQASNVYLVMRPGSNKPGTVTVLLDGRPIDSASAGSDVKNGVVTIDEDRLYNLVDLRGKTETHTLELRFDTPGVEAFAFTFG